MFAAEVRSDEPEVDRPSPTFDPIAASAIAMTYIAHAGDGSGRLFVTLQSGNIRVLEGEQLSSICQFYR